MHILRIYDSEGSAIDFGFKTEREATAALRYYSDASGGELAETFLFRKPRIWTIGGFLKWLNNE